MAERTIDFSPLMEVAGINYGGQVKVNEQMSGLERNPKDDWLYLGVSAVKRELETRDISSFACIGSANGIDVIAALKTAKGLKKVIVTDILPEILPEIRKNVESNATKEINDVDIQYVAGRDCLPLNEKVDLIYGNLPLIMVAGSSLDNNLATTTLTDASSYMHLNQGESDPLKKWSLLSQLGFLMSAKDKLNQDGVIVTLIGGRVPYGVISKVFDRANLNYKELYCGFKRQSDAQFLREYADYEQRENIQFCFYDYGAASEILRQKTGIAVPDIIDGYTGEQLKVLLQSAQINATQGYEYAIENKSVGHLAHAFEASAV